MGCHQRLHYGRHSGQDKRAGASAVRISYLCIPIFFITVLCTPPTTPKTRRLPLLGARPPTNGTRVYGKRYSALGITARMTEVEQDRTNLMSWPVSWEARARSFLGRMVALAEGLWAALFHYTIDLRLGAITALIMTLWGTVAPTRRHRVRMFGGSQHKTQCSQRK